MAGGNIASDLCPVVKCINNRRFTESLLKEKREKWRRGRQRRKILLSGQWPTIDCVWRASTEICARPSDGDHIYMAMDRLFVFLLPATSVLSAFDGDTSKLMLPRLKQGLPRCPPNVIQYNYLICSLRNGQFKALLWRFETYLHEKYEDMDHLEGPDASNRSTIHLDVRNEDLEINRILWQMFPCKTRHKHWALTLARWSVARISSSDWRRTMRWTPQTGGNRVRSQLRFSSKDFWT